MNWINYCWNMSKDLAGSKSARLHIFLSLLITGDLPKINLPSKMTPKLIHDCLQVKPKGFMAIAKVRATPSWTTESLPYKMEDKKIMVLEMVSLLEVKAKDDSNKEAIFKISSLVPCDKTPITGIENYNY